jgi:hypothetical protein
MNNFAATLNCGYLTLTAASDDLVPLFARHGFTLEKNQMSRMARAMEKKVKGPA